MAVSNCSLRWGRHPAMMAPYRKLGDSGRCDEGTALGDRPQLDSVKFVARLDFSECLPAWQLAVLRIRHHP
jgi:hypothetical protein